MPLLPQLIGCELLGGQRLLDAALNIGGTTRVGRRYVESTVAQGFSTVDTSTSQSHP
jgi:hypothetical protein